MNELPPGFVLDERTAASQDGSAVQPAEAPQEKGFFKRAAEAFGSRETAVSAGGTIGAAIGGIGGAVAGAPTGPGAVATSAGGAIAGGALGSMAGSAVYDNVTNLVKAIQDKPEEVVNALGVTKNMLKEGATDAAFSMGGGLLQPVRLGRALLAKMSGVTTEASEAIQQAAQRFGIGLGAVDAGGSLPGAYAKTIGVFPFAGTPLRKAEKAKIEQANTAVDRILDDFGPAATMDQIGIDMVQAAKGANAEFKGTAAGLYRAFDDAVQSAARQDIIPTRVLNEDGSIGGIRAWADQAMQESAKAEIKLADGTVMPRVGTEEADSFISSLSKLPELITPTQYRQLITDLSDLIGKRLKDGTDVRKLTEAKRAMEESFANVRTDLLPQGEGEAVRNSLDAANTFYAKGIVQFQTRAAQAFERVDRLIFSSGAEKAGSLNADEIYKVAVNLKSPQQIADLTKLVGRGNIKRAASRHFDDAVNGARTDVQLMGQTISMVDPFALEKHLGLDKASQLSGLREFYKTAGVDLDRVSDLLNVMKKIEGIGNASEFVRRRAVLGGTAALTGIGAGVGAAGGASAGAITTVGTALLARHFSKVFASPEKLLLMTTALDEAKQIAVRRMALSKVVNGIIQEEDE